GSCADVERQSAANDHDSVRLPTSEHAPDYGAGAGEERNVINERSHHTVPDIPVRVAIIGAPVVWIHWRAAAVRVRVDIERVGPRVSELPGESLVDTLAEDRAHAFVVRDQIVADRADRADEVLVRPPAVHRTRSGQRRVVVKAPVEM